MSEATLTHGSFTVKRHYDAAVERVFHAFSDPAARRRWLVEGDGWTVHAYHPPARLEPGATEHSSFSPPNAEVVLTNDTTFLEVEANALLVFAYAMTIAGAPLSSSLSTVQMRRDGDRTLLTFTEQGVYRDGNIAGRKEGTAQLLESLEREIAR